MHQNYGKQKLYDPFKRSPISTSSIKSLASPFFAQTENLKSPETEDKKAQILVDTQSEVTARRAYCLTSFFKNMEKHKNKPRKVIVDPFELETEEETMVIRKEESKVEFIRHHTFIEFNHMLSYTEKQPYKVESFCDLTPKESERMQEELKFTEEELRAVRQESIFIIYLKILREKYLEVFEFDQTHFEELAYKFLQSNCSKKLNKDWFYGSVNFIAQDVHSYCRNRKEAFLKMDDGTFKSLYQAVSIDFCCVCKTFGCTTHRKEIFGIDKPTSIFRYI